jgi:hypothetical protein
VHSKLQISAAPSFGVAVSHFSQAGFISSIGPSIIRDGPDYLPKLAL